jgi:hypothetical protein
MHFSLFLCFWRKPEKLFNMWPQRNLSISMRSEYSPRMSPRLEDGACVPARPNLIQRANPGSRQPKSEQVYRSPILSRSMYAEKSTKFIEREVDADPIRLFESRVSEIGSSVIAFAYGTFEDSSPNIIGTGFI